MSCCAVVVGGGISGAGWLGSLFEWGLREWVLRCFLEDAAFHVVDGRWGVGETAVLFRSLVVWYGGSLSLSGH